MQKISPAKRTKGITYAVRDVVVLAKQVAATGKEMLYLNIGDPNLYDFRTPQHILDAAKDAMERNKNGYSPSSGIDEAVTAIRREAGRKGIQNIQDVFVTTGASEGIEICLTALVNEGENVLTPSPGYPLYNAILSKLEAVERPYYLDEENGWQPDLEDIAGKIDEKTRAIVLINPNNPTGSVCEKATLLGLIELAKQHNIVIFADEIYDKLILDEDKPHTSIAALDPDVPFITFNGLSKSYLGPGWRIGWGIVSGNAEVLKDYIDGINKILRARLCANHPEQYAIAPALEGDQSHIEEMKVKLRRRRDITVEMLNEIPGISCVRPLGAFYAFPRIDIPESDKEFVQNLLRETGVVVVHGSGFGQRPGTKHFRIVFLPQEEVLTNAYRQIFRYMEKHYSKFGLTV
ncbi:aminotransferase class I/II-fold pyridoxal phosphate-dependent enzyme [bacterium]|nr:aminotransferase class I/II-fold pyridoxal phosphate-dependent enzyme [bacterium]MBU1636172.1 aminotransferase class I/II-fold pyridoxal phosphate-dependent enzyme [bacterium]